MSYLLETEVLPYLHRRLSREERSGWILLRTVDIMESSLKQQLEDLPLSPTQQISYESFAGQTDIRLWVEAESSERVDVELKGLRKEVAARLGDHIYGEGEDRLEQVVYQALVKSGNSLALAECATGGSLTEAFADPHSSTAIAGLQFDRFEDMGQYLELERSPAGTDLAGWCQSAATKLLAKMGANLALVTGKNKSQGGVQVVVSLASSNGVSVTQRSFGGHPENIDQWCYTLALSHLRRWLLAHH
jgi:nicotinamide-nucleotide amidase